MTIQLCDTTTEGRAATDRGHLAKQDGDAIVAGHRHLFERLLCAQVAFAAHHQFGFALFDHRAPGSAVGRIHRLDELGHRQSTGRQRLRIGLDLPGAHRTAHTGYFSHVRHGF